jgi:hypothetical protein
MNYLSTPNFKASCVVVIPVHSPEPSHYELISFKQCFEVLHDYSIYVMAPEGMDMRKYQKIVPDFEIISISTKWLSSKLYYNKLKLSRFFYEFFDDYTYLLTYELDAFIFKDDLEYWCSKEYDYIGAPWFKNNDPVEGKIYATGNSGFSLRKIASIKEGIKHVHLMEAAKYKPIKKMAWAHKYKSLFLSVVGVFSYMESLFSRENKSIQNADFTVEEDTVIVNFMSNSIKNFKLAPITEAYKFSFEVGPDVLFNMNDKHLPTGCHAWWRYNLSFWKPYIENFGYQL